ncbi:hypothetical protein [Salipiger sp.]|uniref:hypothetical protein n=1 Tax=Salipiger sp. TaxID=2078585 RepID=UPI003A969F7E
MIPAPDATEQGYLDELLTAMRGPCEETRPVPSEILSDAFAREFRATLLIHHYFLGSPLATNSFEAAFTRAARSGGHRVAQADDGQRFWDVEIDGRKISLKSTAQKGLRARRLHISKLCEAAWIQDMRGPAQREEATKRLFADYTATVDSIIQLRLFRAAAHYELVEIPTSLLRQVAHVPRAAFAPDGPSIAIPEGAPSPEFTLKLDRSDAKVTLTNIDKAACRVLATWQLRPEGEFALASA